MQTDHDPRELEKWAAGIKASDILGCALIARDHADDLAWVPGQAVKVMSDYILATVREDDGEEQPPTIVGRSDRLVLEMQAGKSGRRIRLTGDLVPDATITFNIAGPYTRGQFRDLCRGLGIIEPTRE